MDIYKIENLTKEAVAPGEAKGRFFINSESSYTEKLAHWHSSAGKRILDIGLSASVVIFLLPWLWLLIGLIIKLNSKGPVLFTQKRVGKNGKLFTCFKFRTMHPNDVSDAVRADANDSRITSVGKALRLSRIDEMLQFINVLKGEMSLVGPRPHMLSDDVFFSKIHRGYCYRKLVKPGLTGLAQAKGFHGAIHSPQNISDRTRMDLFYLKKASFGFDLKILFLTFRTSFLKKTSP